MQAEASPPARPVQAALFLAVAAYAAVFAHGHWEWNLVHPPADLSLLVQFKAETPYQYRLLVPLLIRGLEELGLPALLGLSLEALARWIDGLVVVGIFYATRALLGRFLANRAAAGRWALLALWALPFLYLLPRMWPYWYPSDTTAVLCMTLGVLWIRDQDWPKYYWLFPLATLNRESTSFLIAVFALTQFGRLRLSALAAHLAVQTAIWITIKALLQFTFIKNEGVGAYFAEALSYNWSLRGEPERWWTLSMVYGFLWIPLAWLSRHVRDPFVRRSLVLVPLFFVVSYVLAQFDELRVYGEMLPLVVLGVAVGARDRRARRDGVGARATAPSAP
ncbi:MAG: hypothetical protein IPK67_06950 [Planctomycetes bacterium]|nr:hypothetical protein [Planctomycetota bacterium]